MSKIKFLAVIAIAFALAFTAVTPATSPAPAQAAQPVVVQWFVGLGTGGNPEQIDAQEQVVAGFNAINEDIQIDLVIVNNDVAYDTLNTLLASGDAPDIVGPVGIRGSNSFSGNWLDLEPYLEDAGVDLSLWNESLVDFYRTDEGLVGLPFGQFPSMIFYNRDLFDAANLPYPPQEYGEPYADGDTWDFDKMSEIAMLLTIDANGNDATSADFDPENIVQFGFHNQWTDPRGMASSFGPGSFVDEDGNAMMPEHWAEYFEWYYDAVWEDHFIPNSSYQGSDLLAAGNPFSSGNVAMGMTHLWYTCCLGDVSNWDLAVHPEYDGEVTAKLHADTFRILNTTEHPVEALKVLHYLVTDAAPELLAVYGGMPAISEEWDAFFAGLDETYTQGVNWQVAIDSLDYPDNPSHESNMPNFQKADERIGAFQTLIDSTPDLDIEEEMAILIEDLQAIFDEE